MNYKTKILGTGMTQYAVEYPEVDKDISDRIRDVAKAAQFDNLFDEVFQWCMEKFPEGTSHINCEEVEEGDDTASGYATRVLGMLLTAKNFHEKGLYDLTITAMFSIGMLINEANLKFEWEPFALTGKKFFENNGVGNEPRKKEARKREKIINERAVEIKKANPQLSKTRIAEQIKEELEKLGITEKLSVHTIRQKIKFS